VVAVARVAVAERVVAVSAVARVVAVSAVVRVVARVKVVAVRVVAVATLRAQQHTHTSMSDERNLRKLRGRRVHQG